MKNVLITGAKSYIGTSVEKWLLKEPERFHVETLDMQDPNWREFDFSKFDVVYHVAGIAHVSSKKKLAPLYFKVNRDLAIETAVKAKISGVKQFIFMSSMIIYGKENKIGNFSHVDTSKYNPINAYGNSKLSADLEIQKLATKEFITAIIRTPLVYGPACKGNFPKLISLSKKAFIIPNVKNQRSMIYIDNLTEFVKLVINNSSEGVFYPQNKEYVCVKDVISQARLVKNRNTRLLTFPTLFLKTLAILIPAISKVFGNKTYDLEISKYFNNKYCVVDNLESYEIMANSI
jgi:nucleoside-diphosphate-sugar epimerase